MRYRVFGQTGLKVSTLALGTGVFGTGWGYGASRDEAQAVFDGYRAALDDLVRSGKIIYAGLSDFPAWRVATAATTAELRGWAPISALQLEYSLVERTVERELLPMASGFNLGVDLVDYPTVALR